MNVVDGKYWSSQVLALMNIKHSEEMQIEATVTVGPFWEVVIYILQLGTFSQLRPHLPDRTGSRPISKVKLGRAPLVL